MSTSSTVLYHNKSEDKKLTLNGSGKCKMFAAFLYLTHTYKMTHYNEQSSAARNTSGSNIPAVECIFTWYSSLSNLTFHITKTTADHRFISQMWIKDQTQTDAQTDRQTDCNTPLPYRGGLITNRANFLLLTIILFSLAFTLKVLLTEICRVGNFNGMGHIEAKFKG